MAGCTRLTYEIAQEKGAPVRQVTAHVEHGETPTLVRSRRIREQSGQMYVYEIHIAPTFIEVYLNC